MRYSWARAGRPDLLAAAADRGGGQPFTGLLLLALLLWGIPRDPMRLMRWCRGLCGGLICFLMAGPGIAVRARFYRLGRSPALGRSGPARGWLPGRPCVASIRSPGSPALLVEGIPLGRSDWARLFLAALWSGCRISWRCPTSPTSSARCSSPARWLTGTSYPLFFSTTDYLGVVHSYLLGMFLRLAGISLYHAAPVHGAHGRPGRGADLLVGARHGPAAPAVLAAGLMLTSPMHIVIGSHAAWMNCHHSRLLL